MRKELCWSFTGNLRHKGVLIPERDANCNLGRNAVERTNSDAGAWVTLDRVVEYYEGDGYTEELWAKTSSSAPGETSQL
jgi:hypothetical protein